VQTRIEISPAFRWTTELVDLVNEEYSALLQDRSASWKVYVYIKKKTKTNLTKGYA
jgi:hypothetical protein